MKRRNVRNRMPKIRSAFDFRPFRDVYRQSVDMFHGGSSPADTKVARFYAKEIGNAIALAKKHGEKPSILITGGMDEKTAEVVRGVLNSDKIGRVGKVNYIDIDPRTKNITKAWAQRERRKVNARTGDVRKLPGRWRGKHHAIVTDMFIQFFSRKDKERVLREWNSALKLGGRVITTIPIKLTAREIEEAIEKGKINSESRNGNRPPGRALDEWLERLLRDPNTDREKAAEIANLSTSIAMGLEGYGKIEAFRSADEFESMAQNAGFELQMVQHRGQTYYTKDGSRLWGYAKCVLIKIADLKARRH